MAKSWRSLSRRSGRFNLEKTSPRARAAASAAKAPDNGMRPCVFRSERERQPVSHRRRGPGFRAIHPSTPTGLKDRRVDHEPTRAGRGTFVASAPLQRARATLIYGRRIEVDAARWAMSSSSASPTRRHSHLLPNQLGRWRTGCTAGSRSGCVVFERSLLLPVLATCQLSFNADQFA
jgi:hypothetical protein